ncbi:MAG: hypothetical protein EHM35_20435 [Planctomycetaceae bacterium]|nr:MAG: hypothetical protein EHM35_20435 [Planctomycetaceae bacterium]
MATNDTVQLAIKGLVQNNLVVVTHHYRLTDQVMDEDDVIGWWRATCQAPYLAILSSTYQLTGLTCRQVCGSLPLRQPAEYSYPTAYPVGGVGTAALPNQTALIFSLKTGFAGRRFRGRFYLGGLAYGSLQSTGLWQSATITASNTYGTAARNLNAGVQAVPMVVHSPTNAAVPGTQCQDCSTLVTSIIVRDIPGTQRRRRIGVGA